MEKERGYNMTMLPNLDKCPINESLLGKLENIDKIDELLVLSYISSHYEKEGVDCKKMAEDREIKRINIDKAIDNLKRHFIVFEPKRDFLVLQPWFLERLR